MGKDIRIRSRDSGDFDCYLALPNTKEKVPGVVLAAAVNGVTEDIRTIADSFAASGYIAAAPDLFWRTIPGPLPREDKRSSERAKPRLERIKTGENDMADTLAELRKLPQFNGRSLAAGFCYGGPYAVVGPRRLGFDAGISLHGSQMLDFIGDAEGITKPVCIIWGDQDGQAGPPVVEAYRALAQRAKNFELHIIPGVKHAYMFRDNPPAYDQKTYDFSMERALSLLDGLRTERETAPA